MIRTTQKLRRLLTKLREYSRTAAASECAKRLTVKTEAKGRRKAYCLAAESLEPILQELETFAAKLSHIQVEQIERAHDDAQQKTGRYDSAANG